MEESYSEGLASRIGPESCIGVREGAGEALIGVRAGWVLSREMPSSPRGGLLRGADVLGIGGRQHPRHRKGEMSRSLARSQTPSMYGRISHGNREVPFSSVAVRRAERIGKS